MPGDGPHERLRREPPLLRRKYGEFLDKGLLDASEKWAEASRLAPHRDDQPGNTDKARKLAVATARQEMWKSLQVTFGDPEQREELAPAYVVIAAEAVDRNVGAQDNGTFMASRAHELALGLGEVIDRLDVLADKQPAGTKSMRQFIDESFLDLEQLHTSPAGVTRLHDKMELSPAERFLVALSNIFADQMDKMCDPRIIHAAQRVFEDFKIRDNTTMEWGLQQFARLALNSLKLRNQTQGK